MTIVESMKYFKSGYDLCKQLNISYSNLVRWKKQNFIPVTQQLKINQLTGVHMPIDLDKKSMEERIK